MNSDGKTRHWDSTKLYFSTRCITNCVKIVHSSFQNISDTLSHLLRSERSIEYRKDEKTPRETPSNCSPSLRIQWLVKIPWNGGFTLEFPSSEQGRKWLKTARELRCPGFKF